MSERRTYAEEVALPQNLEAFTRDGVRWKDSAVPPRPATSANDSAEMDPPHSSEPATVVPMSKSTEPRSRMRGQRRGSSASSGREPENRSAPNRSSELLDDILVPLTTKLRRRTVQALRRSYLEQKLAGRTPATQQDIIEEAIECWLERRGVASA